MLQVRLRDFVKIPDDSGCGKELAVFDYRQNVAKVVLQC